jgi:hypothetical protein
MVIAFDLVVLGGSADEINITIGDGITEIGDDVNGVFNG